MCNSSTSKEILIKPKLPDCPPMLKMPLRKDNLKKKKKKQIIKKKLVKQIILKIQFLTTGNVTEEKCNNLCI